MSAYTLSPGSTWARWLLAILGGYLLALGFSIVGAIALTRLFDMPRAEAFITTSMLAYLIWMLAILVAFAARTTWRACAWILGPSLVFGLMAWALTPLPAPVGG